MDRPERLPRGYTNDTTKFGDAVWTVFLGPDASQRMQRELAAATRLRDLVPVPEVLGVEPDALELGFVDGTHGQELIDEGRADPVLRLCGDLARRLDAVPVTLLDDSASRRAVP